MPQTFPEIFYLYSSTLSKQSSCHHSICQPSILSNNKTVTDLTVCHGFEKPAVSRRPSPHLFN